MKTTLILIAALISFLCLAQIQNINIGSTSGGDTGDTGGTKINNNFAYVEAQIVSNTTVLASIPTNGLTNLVLTFTNLPAGSPATGAVTGVTNGVAYYVGGIAVGATGAAGMDSTNAIWPTSLLMLTNINPLYCNGSNFLGQFSQLYDYTLLTPSTSVGTSVGSNLNEVVYASYTGTNNWFAVTNDSHGHPAIFTNVFVSVVGDNNTNYAGAITIYGLQNPSHYSNTNDITSQHLVISDAGSDQEPVSLKQMNTSIANATASLWRNSGSHLIFAPANQTNMDLAIGGAFGGWATKILNSGTNWLLTVTNMPPNYQVQYTTNLNLTLGWVSLIPGTDYTVATNLYSATNAWTFTIPKVSVPATYAFFRAAAFQVALTTVYPPLVVYGGVISPSNTWAASYTAATNQLRPGGFAHNVNSNGLSEWKVFNSNGVFYTSPQ